MMSRQWVYVLFLIVFSVIVRAEIQTGYDWLASQVRSEGSYSRQEDIANAYQSTSEAIMAFALKNDTISPNIINALDFLQADSLDSIERLSRRIITHQTYSQDISVWITALKNRANEDGGYGSYKGHQSTILDTSYAIQALAIGGEIDSEEANYAVAYLLEKQNNGQWRENEATDLYVHIVAMHAVWYYRHQYSSVPTAIELAKQYLLQQQGPDLLWNESYLSALSLLALIPIYDNLTFLADSIDALHQLQHSSGSFEDDVYLTALCLQVLTMAEQERSNPDLASILGRVIDANSNLPLAGVNIDLSGNNDEQWITKDEGIFLFNELIPGTFQITITAIGYSPISVAINLARGQTLTLNDINLLIEINTTTGIIKGIVLDSINQSPLRNASVSLEGTIVAVTKADGRYQITQVTPGVINLSITKPNYSIASISSTVIAGGYLQFNPFLAPVSKGEIGTVLHGTLTDGQTQQPLAGVQVMLTGINILQSETDNQGYYQISGLEAGQTNISLFLDNYDPLKTDTVLIENTTITYSPKLYPTGTTPNNEGNVGFKGIVVDSQTNQTLSQVKIHISTQSNNIDLLTDVNGEYYVDNLQGKMATLQFTLDGYLTTTFNMQILLANIFDLEQVRLRPEGITQILPDLTINFVKQQSQMSDNALVINDTLEVQVHNQGTFLASA